MKTIAQRMDELPINFFADYIAKIKAMQSAGNDIIRLDVGSPDLPPAPHIIEALARSAATPDRHGYQAHAGTKAIRQAWRVMYQRVFDVNLDPDKEIVPLLGSKEGIFHLMMALIDPGDLALIPDPGYITYTHGTQIAGGEPYYLPLLPDRDFIPDLTNIPIEIAQRAKVLWLNYPNNPTAATATLDFFSEAIGFARRYNILLCHDAPYTQVTFEDYQAPSVLQIPGAREVCVEFNSLSKSHNMAGWRVGAALGNAQSLRALYTLKTNADSSHFLPILDAATEAMTSDQSWIHERNQTYCKRRDAVLEALKRFGLPALKPMASIYVWSPIPEDMTSMEFAYTALEEAHVSMTPGSTFGKYGEGNVRISLTEPIERIEEAMFRLEGWLQK